MRRYAAGKGAHTAWAKPTTPEDEAIFREWCRKFAEKHSWKAVAGEKETENLKNARRELDGVESELDQATRLLARRSEQANNPDLPDAVVAEYNTQIAGARSRVATLTEKQYQRCSGLKQAHFDKALKEKLSEGVEQSIGADYKDELLAHYDFIKNNPWADPVELSDILQELSDLTKVYIATEDDTRILAALWVGVT